MLSHESYLIWFLETQIQHKINIWNTFTFWAHNQAASSVWLRGYPHSMSWGWARACRRFIWKDQIWWENKTVIWLVKIDISSSIQGPGIFFIIPCIDHYKKVDLRTVTFDVPPQALMNNMSLLTSCNKKLLYNLYQSTTWNGTSLVTFVSSHY